MTIRKLLLILFLYVLLVWILAAYLHAPDVKELVNFGLLWTAVGIALLLCGLLFERIYSWWRSRKVEPSAQAQAPGTKPTTGPRVLSEDDLALVSLIKEADQRLAQAPGHSTGGPASVLDLPLYLAMGPERAGKTAVIHNSGLEPSLLAGQAIGNDGTIAPTKTANLWLAHESLFLEVSGRIFAGDHLAAFLNNLRPPAATGWKTWFTPQRPAAPVRGILLFFDAREFMGTPEPSRLDRWAQAIRSRLSEAAGFFGAECPVYVLFTNTDALPYFEEFFRALAEAETGQTLGVITDAADVQTPGRVWAEAETRRLNQYFQALFLRLSDRRLLALGQETDPSRRPSTYEFPREFRRIRGPLVQFLVDVFKPDPLNPASRLRGIFFTATRKVEQTGIPVSGSVTQAYQPHGTAPNATQIFAAGGMTSVFRLDTKSTSGRLVERWMFTADFFQHVLSLDRPVVKSIPRQSNFDKRKKLLTAVAAGVAAILALLWTVSWAGNWGLVTDVETAVTGVHSANADLSMANLQKLENLRAELEQLQQGHPWFHWGLFKGDDLRAMAAKAYFARLKQLSLERLNQTLAVDLRQAGSAAPPADASTTYDRLKTHRTIAARACSVDQPLVRRVLADTVPQAHGSLGADQRALLETQLNFYVTELAANKNLPLNLVEDGTGVDTARAFVRRQNGLDQRLRGLLSELSGQVKALMVPPEYHAVLTGPTEFKGEFTKQGELIFEDRVAHDNFGSEERCVMGDSVGQQVVQQLDTGTRDQLRSLYYRWYADAWRDFLASYKVIAYKSADDAVQKLNILTDSQSPLLGIVRMVAENTNFQGAKPGEPSWWEKATQKVGLGAVDQAQSAGGKSMNKVAQLLATDAPLMTAADVATLFRPVLVTTPPSGLLVNDNNKDYMEGLRKLRDGIDAYAQASAADKPAALVVSNTDLTQARNAHTALADKFPDVGKEGLNKILSDFLYQPIAFAATLIPQNKDKLSVSTKNGDLQKFCQTIAPTLRKYPFTTNVDTDATLDDLKNLFGPDVGKVWQYALQSGADLVVLQGQTWDPKPGATGVTVAPELLKFLDRAQDLKRAFFADGSEPHVRYTLRRVENKQIVGIRFRLDGQELPPDQARQTTFDWPAKSSADRGAEGSEVFGKDIESGFGDFPDLWGVFRLFQNADDRPLEPLNKPIVTWSKTRGKGGAALQPLKPPAQIQVMDSSGNVDLFNPRFFDDLKCPPRAVVLN